MLRLPLLLALACASAPALAANCTVTPFSALPGQDASAEMVVRSGTGCGVGMKVQGSGAMTMTIGRQATNGTATTPTTMSFAYAPRRGFTGHDSFEADFTGELLRDGKGVNLRGTSHIAVDVTVVR